MTEWNGEQRVAHLAAKNKLLYMEYCFEALENYQFELHTP